MLKLSVNGLKTPPASLSPPPLNLTPSPSTPQPQPTTPLIRISHGPQPKPQYIGKIITIYRLANNRKIN